MHLKIFNCIAGGKNFLRKVFTAIANDKIFSTIIKENPEESLYSRFQSVSRNIQIRLNLAISKSFDFVLFFLLPTVSMFFSANLP